MLVFRQLFDPASSTYTFAFSGLWEVAPTALAERLANRSAPAIQVVDVRESAEFTDAFGHVAGAVSLPLSDLAARMGELRSNQPVVTVCRSGARSAQAAVLLQKAGFQAVANLAGGLLRWRAEQLPVEGDAQ